MLELINYNISDFKESFINLIQLNVAYNLNNVYYNNKCDSEGNVYIPFTQTTNLTDSYVVSFNKKGEFRWCKLLKDTTASLNGRQMVTNIDVDENDRIHCYGRKRLVPQNSNDADGFYVIFNQDGSVYKNLGYSDNPAASYYEAIRGCLTKDHSVMVGVKWSNTYNSARPHLFIFDKIGNLQKSLWSNIKNTSVNRFYNVFSIPNTNNIIMTNMDTTDYIATGVTRFINYNITTNKIDFNISFNTLTQTGQINTIRCGNVLFDKDNNMYFIGYLYSSPNFIHIIKTNQNRQILFSKTYFRSGLSAEKSFIRGFELIDSTLYLGCLTNTSNECLVFIDCETGNVKKSFINNGTKVFSQIGGYKDSLSFVNVSQGKIDLTKLFLNDLRNHNSLKIDEYFDIRPCDFITANVVSSITNYSDISLANASYTTSTILNISDVTMKSQEKFNGICH